MEADLIGQLVIYDNEAARVHPAPRVVTHGIIIGESVAAHAVLIKWHECAWPDWVSLTSVFHDGDNKAFKPVYYFYEDWKNRYR